MFTSCERIHVLWILALMSNPRERMVMHTRKCSCSNAVELIGLRSIRDLACVFQIKVFCSLKNVIISMRDSKLLTLHWFT
ncbi:unnamed protein product [Calypogeia fissa]